MKINHREVVTRYSMTFEPWEVRILARDVDFAAVISTKAGENKGMHPNNRYGHAMLTKAQINRACDLLGINGREWFAQHAPEPN